MSIITYFSIFFWYLQQNQIAFIYFFHFYFQILFRIITELGTFNYTEIKVDSR